VNYGFDWVYLVAGALVLAALGFGVAVGYGTRKQLLQQ
jgi:ABC-type transporter Mla subunit MlaD